MNNQEIIKKVSKLEKELAEVKQEINKQEVNKNEEWKPEKGNYYWCYARDARKVLKSVWLGDDYDAVRLKDKVIFKNLEEAQRYADYQKAKDEYSYEFSKEEWEDSNICKYSIYYNNYDKKIYIDADYCYRYIYKPYFKTEEQAQEFIDKYKNEILEFEFGIKEDK